MPADARGVADDGRAAVPLVLEVRMRTMSGLSIDMPTDAVPIRPDDWIATKAGSRYVVVASRPVKCRTKVEGCDRCTDSVMRWAVSVERLPKHEPIPPDVRVIDFHWHKRGQR